MTQGATTFVRLDDQGRLILPVKLRTRLGWEPQDEIEVRLYEMGSSHQVMLTSTTKRCALCGSVKNLQTHMYSGKRICKDCRDSAVHVD